MKWFITGGAGFIGCNAARRMMCEGDDVIVFDNLSRPGSRENLDWLRTQGEFVFVEGNVSDKSQVNHALTENRGVDVVLHLAAQTAVTASVEDPRQDFESNLCGTFNICEAVRQLQPDALLMNAATNKVYGAMSNDNIMEMESRYCYRNQPCGISETQPLDFHSPYGCSKGGADQYVRDYSRIYGIRTVSFRQSCIYGIRQFGVEDQGWVAWFVIRAVAGKGVTIYGDGKQMRDLLYIDDLVDCYRLTARGVETAAGNVYNLGGGPENTLSVLELVSLVSDLAGRETKYTFDEWRPGDQKVFVSDIREIENDIGWRPETRVPDGVGRLFQWVNDNKHLFDV